METYYILPESYMDKRRFWFLRRNPRVVERSGVVLFGDREVMDRLFEESRKK